MTADELLRRSIGGEIIAIGLAIAAIIGNAIEPLPAAHPGAGP